LTLLEALQEANSAVKGIKGLSFANIQEFNSFTDSFNFNDWPRNVVVPIVLDGTFREGDPRPHEIINLQGWMVTRINQDTNDYRSVKIEPDYIAPMRAAARTFLRKLTESDLTNPEVGDISYRIGSEYQWLSTHLFGVFYTMRWPVRRC
jgi:hypothetical protein